MFQYVTANAKPLVRCDTMGGKDYLVGPMVMITEGVHDGTDGPILYTNEELNKPGLVGWNHRPVVVYHPQANGAGISACDPVELTKRGIGVTMNVNFEDNAVKAEAWMEPDRIKAVDERVAEAVENEQMMEVSTGVYMTLDREEGDWNGEKYIGIARDIQLDHLAVLPDHTGACSIEDGAGLLRMNEAGDDTHLFEENVEVTDQYVHVPAKNVKLFKKKSLRTIWLSKAKGIRAVIGKLVSNGKSTTIQKYMFVKDKWSKADALKWVKDHKPTGNSVWGFILNEMSHDETRSLLSGALRDKWDDAWLTETFDDYFIYERDGKLYLQDYEIDDGAAKFVGLPKRVEKQVTYKEVSAIGNAKNNQKGKIMDKEATVKQLIDNDKTPWAEEHRDELTAMSETALEQLMAANAEPKPDENKPASNEKKPNAEEKPVSNADEKPQTAEEFIENAPPQIAEVLRAGQESLDAEKTRLIAVVTANEQNVFTEEHLKMKDVKELTALAALAGTKQTEPVRLYNFEGQAPVADAADKPEPMALNTAREEIMKQAS